MRNPEPTERKRRPPVLQILGLIVGLGLLVTPIVFDLVETWQNNQAITIMTDTASAQDNEELQEV